MFLRFTLLGRHERRRSRSGDSSGGGGAQAIIMVVGLLLAILAPFFARLVQLAVSRQREYLADASSVELTRNPVRPGARPGQDLPTTRRCSRSPTGPPSTSTS